MAAVGWAPEAMLAFSVPSDVWFDRFHEHDDGVGRTFAPLIYEDVHEMEDTDEDEPEPEPEDIPALPRVSGPENKKAVVVTEGDGEPISARAGVAGLVVQQQTYAWMLFGMGVLFATNVALGVELARRQSR